MKRSLVSLFAAGAIVCMGAIVAAPARAASPTTQGSWRNDPAHEARRIVAEAADRTLQKDAVTKVLELVNKTDRDRIEKDINKSEESTFQAAADKVQDMWKEKYGHKFDAQGHVNALKDIKVAFSGKGAGETAIIHIPAEPGEAAYDLHLMKEKNGYWRFQVPDSLTGANFYKDLTDSLNKMVAEKDKLPATADQAYERSSAWLLHELVFPAGSAEAVPASEKK